MNLQTEISAMLDSCDDESVRAVYVARLAEGTLAREENPASHFCAYFVPFNKIAGTVLIGNHKKSGLWLMPGGHIEPNESLLTTLNREIFEELGVEGFYTETPKPFLLSITHIVSDVRPCKEHFDIWFMMETDGADFVIDDSEYHETRWVTLEEAKGLTKDPANLEALEKLEGMG
jgi:8-oxo-dGTP diphosphatase